MQGSDGWPIDDAKKGILQVASSGPLLAAAVGSILSMALYNWFGVSVMKQLSAASRLSIDACRTALVWAFSVIAGWESFVGMQLFGFLILICGTTLYNELLANVVRDSEWCAPAPPAHEHTLQCNCAVNVHFCLQAGRAAVPRRLPRPRRVRRPVGREAAAATAFYVVRVRPRAVPADRWRVPRAALPRLHGRPRRLGR